MTRIMDEEEVKAVVDAMVDVLREPDPDPAVLAILEGLPLTSVNLGKILASVAIIAAEYTLVVAGVDLRDPDERARHRVQMHTFMPPDDTPDWEKSAGQLISDACTGVLARKGDRERETQVLAMTTTSAVVRGPVHVFMTLAAVLGHIRRLLHGDLRGVIVS